MTTREDVIAALKKVYDPEITDVDIWELGLIYGIEIEDARVSVTMTLTSAGCPAGPQIVSDARREILAAEGGVEDVAIEVVWDPPWSPERMSEAARLTLGFL